MIDQHKSVVKQIDDHIRQHEWFDFHLWRYDGQNLIISGSKDLCYYHKLEIIFSDVFFAQTLFQGWHSDTTQVVFEIPKENHELNRKFEIEQGYQIFIFRTEDFKNDIYIAAREIAFNTDTVYYYHRENLKENERLADFLSEE